MFSAPHSVSRTSAISSVKHHHSNTIETSFWNADPGTPPDPPPRTIFQDTLQSPLDWVQPYIDSLHARESADMSRIDKVSLDQSLSYYNKVVGENGPEAENHQKTVKNDSSLFSNENAEHSAESIDDIVNLYAGADNTEVFDMFSMGLKSRAHEDQINSLVRPMHYSSRVDDTVKRSPEFQNFGKQGHLGLEVIQNLSPSPKIAITKQLTPFTLSHESKVPTVQQNIPGGKSPASTVVGANESDIVGGVGLGLIFTFSDHANDGKIPFLHGNESRLSRHILVDYVFPHSSAESVINVGDIILSVDHKDVKNMTESEFRQAISGRVGTPVSLKFLRNGFKTREDNVTLIRRRPGTTEAGNFGQQSNQLVEADKTHSSGTSSSNLQPVVWESRYASVGSGTLAGTSRNTDTRKIHDWIRFSEALTIKEKENHTQPEMSLADKSSSVTGKVDTLQGKSYKNSLDETLTSDTLFGQVETVIERVLPSSPAIVNHEYRETVAPSSKRNDIIANWNTLLQKAASQTSLDTSGKPGITVSTSYLGHTSQTSLDTSKKPGITSTSDLGHTDTQRKATSQFSSENIGKPSNTITKFDEFAEGHHNSFRTSSVVSLNSPSSDWKLALKEHAELDDEAKFAVKLNSLDRSAHPEIPNSFVSPTLHRHVQPPASNSSRDNDIRHHDREVKTFQSNTNKLTGEHKEKGHYSSLQEAVEAIAREYQASFGKETAMTEQEIPETPVVNMGTRVPSSLEKAQILPSSLEKAHFEVQNTQQNMVESQDRKMILSTYPKQNFEQSMLSGKSLPQDRNEDQTTSTPQGSPTQNEPQPSDPSHVGNSTSLLNSTKGRFEEPSARQIRNVHEQIVASFVSSSNQVMNTEMTHFVTAHDEDRNSSQSNMTRNLTNQVEEISRSASRHSPVSDCSLVELEEQSQEQWELEGSNIYIPDLGEHIYDDVCTEVIENTSNMLELQKILDEWFVRLSAMPRSTHVKLDASNNPISMPLTLPPSMLNEAVRMEVFAREKTLKGYMCSFAAPDRNGIERTRASASIHAAGIHTIAHTPPRPVIDARVMPGNYSSANHMIGIGLLNPTDAGSIPRAPKLGPNGVVPSMPHYAMPLSARGPQWWN